MRVEPRNQGNAGVHIWNLIVVFCNIQYLYKINNECLFFIMNECNGDSKMEWKISFLLNEDSFTIARYSFTIARGEGTSTERDHHTILSLGEIVVGDKRFAVLPCTIVGTLFSLQSSTTRIFRGEFRDICNLQGILKVFTIQCFRDEPIPEKSRFADPIYRGRYKKIIGRLIGYGRYFCVPGYKRRITVFWQLLILVYMPQIDVLVLVCSGKYLLILDSYRSLYESNGYGIKYAQQKCQKQDWV
jgi:hypothetical protein